MGNGCNGQRESVGKVYSGFYTRPNWRKDQHKLGRHSWETQNKYICQQVQQSEISRSSTQYTKYNVSIRENNSPVYWVNLLGTSTILLWSNGPCWKRLTFVGCFKVADTWSSVVSFTELPVSTSVCWYLVIWVVVATWLCPSWTTTTRNRIEILFCSIHLSGLHLLLGRFFLFRPLGYRPQCASFLARRLKNCIAQALNWSTVVEWAALVL